MLLLDTTPENGSSRECWIWFADKPFQPPGYEHVLFKQAKLEVSNGAYQVETFHTLWNDLRIPEKELWANVHKTRRHDIRTARKYGCVFTVGNSQQEIRAAHEAQIAFCTAKNLGLPLSVEVHLRHASHCKVAFVHDSDRKLVSWVLYVLEKPIARCWWGGSDLAYERKKSGDAFSLLHWEMMRHLKMEAFETYDWGGVVIDPSDPRYSITKFKLHFGGDLRTFFNYVCHFPPPLGMRSWRRAISKLGAIVAPIRRSRWRK